MFLAVFALAFVAPEAIAQKNPNANAGKGGGKGKSMTPAERAEKATARMTKRYTLSSTQGASIKAINLQFATDMDALRAKGKEAKEERKARRQKHVADIKAQMTADQVSKFEADLEEAKKRRAEKRANNGKGGGKGKGKGKEKPAPEGSNVQEDLGDEGDDD